MYIKQKLLFTIQFRIKMWYEAKFSMVFPFLLLLLLSRNLFVIHSSDSSNFLYGNFCVIFLHYYDSMQMVRFWQGCGYRFFCVKPKKGDCQSWKSQPKCISRHRIHLQTNYTKTNKNNMHAFSSFPVRILQIICVI